MHMYIYIYTYKSTTHETLQLTLQLDEPGTIWCQASEIVEYDIL